MTTPGSIIVGLTSSASSSSDLIPPSSNSIVHNSNNFTSTDNSSNTHNNSKDEPLSHVGWIIVLVLVALAFGTFLCLAAFLEKRRTSRVTRPATDARTKKKPPSERYLEIEKWLVNKRVEAHDEVCDNALFCGLCHGSNKKNDDDKANHRQRSLTECTSKTDQSQSSDIEEGHNLEECSICFDHFQQGEIVSWSPEPKCQHVFHHHCIKEWLLKKKECPCCRETFLPIDRVQGTAMNHRKTINELILAQQHRSAHCFYCVTHGVVRPSRFGTGRQMKDCDIQAIRLRSECVPTLDELQKIRGVADYDSDELEDTLHSAPSATASGNESSEIETCLETEDMSPVENQVNLADPVDNTRNDSDSIDDDDDLPFSSEDPDIFPDLTLEEI